VFTTKFVSSKEIQKSDGRKIGKYLLTVELTDYDIEMFEEFGAYPTAYVMHKNPDDKRYDKMQKYLRNLFSKIFQRIWRKYDDF